MFDKLGTVIRMNEKLRNSILDDEDKLLIVEEHLEDRPLRQYHARIKQEGPFDNYNAFMRWFRTFFVPADILARRRLDYRNLRQRDDETLDRYYLQFTELLRELDEQPRKSYIISDFVNSLRGNIAEHLAKYPELCDYKKVTVEQVVGKLAQHERLATNNRGASAKSFSNRVSEQSKPRFKQQTNDRKSKPDPNAPLTHEQKRHLEALIARGGKKFVGKDVIGNKEWFEMAKLKNVCATCAAHGHSQRDCSITPKDKDKSGDSGGGKSQFNAMLSDLDSEMQKDYECFASLIDRSGIPLAIFSRSINGECSCSCGDTGASRCCISWKYAIRAGLKVQTTSIRKFKLPNGQVMKSYGSVEFMLTMGEWQGMVTALVLDMDADFDVVLGMEWFLK